MEKSTRSSLDRSRNSCADPIGYEYFWSVELNADKQTFKWTMRDEEEGEEGDEDFIMHSLFLKTAVLGSTAADDQSNVVSLESTDSQGNKVKGAILHLKKGTGNLMCPLDITLNGRQVNIFTLEGSGPVHISGNYLQECPNIDPMDLTQALESTSDESDSEIEEEAKQLNGKGKQGDKTKSKAKAESDQENGEDDEQDEESDSEEGSGSDEEEDNEAEKNKKTKKSTSKKEKTVAKKSAKATKKPGVKTPTAKNGKKAKK